MGITTLGSEHGTEEIIRGAELASLHCYEAETLEGCHCLMEELLDKHEIDACVTMHYNFPLGVSTVGRLITPAKGKEILLATTTGTAAADRVEAMVKNAVYGNIVAKALGIKEPTVGILNVDGARQVALSHSGKMAVWLCVGTICWLLPVTSWLQTRLRAICWLRYCLRLVKDMIASS